jgi:hypothetical protein
MPHQLSDLQQHKAWQLDIIDNTLHLSSDQTNISITQEQANQSLEIYLLSPPMLTVKTEARTVSFRLPPDVLSELTAWHNFKSDVHLRKRLREPALAFLIWGVFRLWRTWTAVAVYPAEPIVGIFMLLGGVLALTTASKQAYILFLLAFLIDLGDCVYSLSTAVTPWSIIWFVFACLLIGMTAREYVWFGGSISKKPRKT